MRIIKFNEIDQLLEGSILFIKGYNPLCNLNDIEFLELECLEDNQLIKDGEYTTVSIVDGGFDVLIDEDNLPEVQ